MKGKRYIAVTVLAWIFILILGWYFVYDIPRMEQASANHKEKMASIGAMLYAENCATCHGPKGEGVVGPPLNVEALQGDPEDRTEVYDLIYKAIDQGRPGTSDPLWVRLDNGVWASYTAMPMWGAENGGPMNEQMIAAITHFIMMGDWDSVNSHIPAPTPWQDEQGNVDWSKFPDGVGISAEASQAGKEIFVSGGCVFCHTLGSAGGLVGPDLTKTGAWGLDREFLHAWIKDPSSVEERAPRYWSNYGGPYQFPVVPSRDEAEASGVAARPVPAAPGEAEPGVGDPQIGGSVDVEFPIPSTQVLPPTQMPAMGLTDEEIEVLVEYLLHLK